MSNDAQVIDLTQKVGQFEEGNLELHPGKYVFSVSNQDVDHEVGFVLKKKGFLLNRNVAAFGELFEGQTKQSETVELEPGEYQYYCPLNPTPKYSITVN